MKTMGPRPRTHPASVKPPLPTHFTPEWAKGKLAEYLKEPVNQLDFFHTSSINWSPEVGYYIYMILNNNHYDEYRVYPDGRVEDDPHPQK